LDSSFKIKSKKDNHEVNKLERNIENQKAQSEVRLNNISKRQSDEIEDLHDTFTKEKAQIIRESRDKVDDRTDQLKDLFARQDEKKTIDFEKRIRKQKRDKKDLVHKMQTQARKLTHSFNKELTEKLRVMDIAHERDRKALKEAIRDKVVVNQKKLERQRVEFDAKIFEIATKNDRNVEGIMKRHSEVLAKIKSDHKKELERKIREQISINKNLKETNELALQGQKDFSDTKVRNLQAIIKKQHAEKRS